MSILVKIVCIYYEPMTCLTRSSRVILISLALTFYCCLLKCKYILLSDAYEIELAIYVRSYTLVLANVRSYTLVLCSKSY